MDRRHFLAALGATLVPTAVRSQGTPAYPSKPVTVIVPFSAGGTADIFARMVAEHLQKTWGQPFVIENVAGAGSIVGVTRVALRRLTAAPSV